MAITHNFWEDNIWRRRRETSKNPPFSDYNLVKIMWIMWICGRIGLFVFHPFFKKIKNVKNIKVFFRSFKYPQFGGYVEKTY